MRLLNATLVEQASGGYDACLAVELATASGYQYRYLNGRIEKLQFIEEGTSRARVNYDVEVIFYPSRLIVVSAAWRKLREDQFGPVSDSQIALDSVELEIGQFNFKKLIESTPDFQEDLFVTILRPNRGQL